MGYLSIRQTAEKWNLSARWISDLCKAGRIPGAMKIGSYWAIPEDAKKPADARIKSGRYVKTPKDNCDISDSCKNNKHDILES